MSFGIPQILAMLLAVFLTFDPAKAALRESGLTSIHILLLSLCITYTLMPLVHTIATEPVKDFETRARII